MVHENGLDDARAFVAQVGYPVIVKPDNGCGAEATYKLKNDAELEAFYAELPDTSYIMEEFINGTIVSFDGVADSRCVPLFYTSNVFPTPLIDIVNSLGDLSYWTQKTVPEELRDVGFRTIKAFGAKSRFFHCEFFRLNEDKEGLGQKGDYVALEVNMRPAGGYTPDLINYANSVDCYQIWADMEMCIRDRYSPGCSMPSLTGPSALRFRRMTSRPTASHMRRIWRLRPSCRVISNTVRPGSSTTTWMTAGWVFTPSSSTTPLDILTICSSVARGRTVTRYSLPTPPEG